MTYHLNIGSNLGDREGNLWAADLRIALDIGFVAARSTIIETAPWGFESQNSFLNIGLAVESRMKPHDVLRAIHDIERELNNGASHRDENRNYRDRLVDIDIVAVDQTIIYTPELTVPHPLLPKRNFFLKPLAETAPEWTHPALGLTAQQMLDNLNLENQ